jgi:hypothetical protein|tara:strand:+ start:2814 stop:3413 length:600 start_codon:yes stop_codon:yes gene_type:complete
MAFVYKKRDFEDGDVPVPEMWNASMNAFSAEMNGLLDRDNLPLDAVGVAPTKYDSSFSTHAFVSTLSFEDEFVVSTDFKGWQRVPISVPSITSPVEEMVEVEGSLQLTNNWGASPPSVDNRARVMFQVLIDGSVVTETGTISALLLEACVPLNGAMPIIAGSHSVELYVRYINNEGTSVTHPDSIKVDRGFIVVNRWKR